MPVTTDPAQLLLEHTRSRAHPQCVVCSQSDPCGLGLRFSLCKDGSVEANFTCRDCLQGYAGILHGGITSALLDGAMTNCLFAHGVVALTGRMTVRFRHPVQLATSVLVRGRIVRSEPPLHMLRAEVLQDGQVMASAESKFMQTAGKP